MSTTDSSPRIVDLEWGHMIIEGAGIFQFQQNFPAALQVALTHTMNNCF